MIIISTKNNNNKNGSQKLNETQRTKYRWYFVLKQNKEKKMFTIHKVHPQPPWNKWIDKILLFLCTRTAAVKPKTKKMWEDNNNNNTNDQNKNVHKKIEIEQSSYLKDWQVLDGKKVCEEYTAEKFFCR